MGIRPIFHIKIQHFDKLTERRTDAYNTFTRED